MPSLTVEVTQGEFFALSTVSVDPQVWADNAVTERARVAKEEMKSSSLWVKAAVAVAESGGDAADDWTVLLKGHEMGLFLTAAQAAAEQEAEIEAIVVPQARDPLKTPLKRVPFFAMFRLRFQKTAQDLVALAEDHIADEAKKALAISKIENEQEFNRDDPLFGLFAPLIDVTPEQIDEAWIEALTLT